MTHTMFFKKNCCNSYKHRCLVFFFVFLMILSGCKSNNSHKSALSPPPANDDYFQEIGKEIGIDFIHSIGDNDLNNIVESSGAGAAFLDYDQDGFIDLYVCSGTWLQGLSQR